MHLLIANISIFARAARRKFVWDLLEKPQSSMAARASACVVRVVLDSAPTDNSINSINAS